MDALNLSSKEKMIFDFIKNVLSGKINNAELREDSAFAEMFINPHIDLITPLADFMDQVSLAQSLENANLLSQEKMDEVGRRYNQIRYYGSRSEGFCLFIFDDIPETGYIHIPKGYGVLTDSNLVFRTLEAVMFNEVTLAQYYNSSTYQYVIPVKVVSEGTGEVYNISPGAIVRVQNNSLRGLIGVDNESPFIGGADMEDNNAFARRIIENFGSPNLGVVSGYHKFIDSFAEVEDKLVAGYRHPLMKRDIVGQVSDQNIVYHENFIDKHWGTKIDIYIRGLREEVVSETLVSVFDNEKKLPYVKLESVPVDRVTVASISTTNAGFSPEEVNVGELMITDYIIEKDEDTETIGTLAEDCKLYLKHDWLTAGMNVDVTYVQNVLPRDIEDVMYNTDDENRPPCADVKIKLSPAKYIAGNVRVGLKENVPLQNADVLYIRTHVESGIKGVAMGTELQLSDIVEMTYQQTSSDGFSNIDYIDLPFQFIQLDKENNYVFECLSNAKKKIIDDLEIPDSYKESFELFKRELTVQNFLIALNAVANKPALFTDEELGITNRFPILRDMYDVYAKFNIPKMLSPDKIQLEMNHYFDMLHLEVHEHKKDLNHFLDIESLLVGIAMDETGYGNVQSLLFFCLLLVVTNNVSDDERKSLLAAILEEME